MIKENGRRKAGGQISRKEEGGKARRWEGGKAGIKRRNEVN